MDPDPAASHKTQSSNLASTNAAIEDDDAKDANISTDVASLASQMPSEDVDLIAASAVRAKRVHRISASLRVSSWKTSTRLSV